MFHAPQQKPEQDLAHMLAFERHNLQVAIERARAEGFEGLEAALVEMLKALNDSHDFPGF